MSEHAWTQEQIAAHVAGGLEAAEGERLLAHAAECPECAAALNETRALDRGLDALFADSRPGPALEDRMIQSLRIEAVRAALRSRWRRKVAWGAAAAVVMGAAGAGIAQMSDRDVLGFPGARARASNALKQMSLATTSYAGNNNSLGADWGDEAPPVAFQNSSKAAAPGDPAAMAQAMRERADKTISDGTSNTIANGAVSEYMRGHITALPPQSPPPAKDAAGGKRFNGFADMDGSVTGLPSRLSVDKGKKHDEYFKPEEFREFRGNAERFAPRDVSSGKEPKLEKDKESPKQPPEQVPPPETSKPGASKPHVPDEPAAPTRKVIRSGDIEFEVESFDSALASVTKLVVAIKGAFVGTVNSDKMANGKVKGSIVVRVPPDSLDPLVLDLRRELGKTGELKGLHIQSEDITKKYTDLESRLRGAKTMEQRLLQIIKEGKGEIKQLLEAEKELGVWRTRIEEFEGEIRYYGSQVALSTLTISLAEKDIRAAADVVDSEHVQAGLEVDDVDKAMREAQAAVAEAKGRITRSELKQQSAGQFTAVLQFEVKPEAAGPLRDRLRQLGNMVRLDIDRVQQAEGGSAPPPRDAKVRRGETKFDVSMYNLAKIQPRETATLQVAVADVPAGYRTLRDAIEKAKGRVVNAELNEQDRQNVTAQLDFEVRRSEEGAMQQALTAAGETVSRTVTRAPESPNVTDAKVLFKTSLKSAANLQPRETVVLGIEVADVDAARAVYAAQVAAVHGRSVDEQVAHERSGRVTGRLVYDVPLSAASGLVEQFKGSGTVRAQQATRNLQAPEGPLALARLEVTLSNGELLVPKDDGLWPQVRKGLSYSLYVLSLSVSWLIFGLCVLGPWALVGYGGYRVVRRVFGTPTAAPVAPVAPPAGGTA